ncbi:protein ABHD15 isoform X1 [Cyprinodon tularosa]|uniref:protein ABHD15 isoform X1 n=2 Tax=Cyprinodon tularosa TaxID=77115 RepID=UPI0018E1ED58|nr:protein ABHD15 isoform X1 [Cyprinodon tularosa]
MESYVLDCLFCLLPSFLLFLFYVGLHCPRLCGWARVAVRASSWRLWVIICLILQLPLHKEKRTKAEDLKSLETDMVSGQVSDGPKLICKPTALARYLLQHCGSLTKAKLAAWPRGDPHLQTFSSQIFGEHRQKVQFTRDHLLLKDGGIVALDWAIGTRLIELTAKRRWEVKKEHQSVRKTLGCFTSTPPVLLLIPQFWGGMTPHLQLLCSQAMRQGFYVVVFHHRGTAGSPLTTTRLTEFGDPSDLEQAVTYVHSRHPSSVLVAVSEGSGSGVLLSYLGERGSSTCITAAAAISPVLLGQLWFESAMPPIYHWGVLFHRKMQLSRYASSFQGSLDVDRALRSSSLRDFEEALFCSPTKKAFPSNERSLNPSYSSLRGFSPTAAWALGERANPAQDWENYWGRNEPLRDADEMSVPVLCICSSDDPLLPPTSMLPLSLFQSNPYFLLALTDKGGHCGFTLEASKDINDGKPRNEEEEEGVWSHTAILEYLKVVSDFLKEAEGDWKSWGGQLETNSLKGQKGRMNVTALPRRRRGAMMKRSRTQPAEQSALDDADGDLFTWKRSYTR